jgi:hypothetical protein
MKIEYAMHVNNSSESIVIHCNTILENGDCVIVDNKTYFVFKAYDTTINVLPVYFTVYGEKV